MSAADEPTITDYRARAELAANAVIGALLKARPALEAFADALQTAAEVCLARRAGGPRPADVALDMLCTSVGRGAEAHAEAHGALLAFLNDSAAMTDRELTTATTPGSRQVELPLQEQRP